ncbi:hypothetical protein BS78_08G015000 [Paspalum vaginatum]|nr:hypothetical protein BS78_08G015000 [Paspalum vaginatum]
MSSDLLPISFDTRENASSSGFPKATGFEYKACWKLIFEIGLHSRQFGGELCRGSARTGAKN